MTIAKRPIRQMAQVGIVLSVLWIAALTLPSRPAGSGMSPNFVPFETVLDQLRHSLAPGGAFRQIVGNIVLFVPLGACLAISGMAARRAVASVFAVTISIETIQHFVIGGRVFDIDDIILNTVGGIVGFAAAWLAMRAAQRIWSSLVA